MLEHLPNMDKDNFVPFGDNSVSMPLRMMERYLFPTIKLVVSAVRREFKTSQDYRLWLRDRSLEDLEMLRAATLTIGNEVLEQIRSEVPAHVDTVSSQMRNTLLALQKACVLPKYDDVIMQEQDSLLKR
jgi:hypothetical protein